MKKAQFNKFLKYFIKNYQVYGPEFDNNKQEVLINKINKASQLVLDGRLPYYPWREYLLPKNECLFQYQNNELKEVSKKINPQALFGVCVSDLKALVLYDQVFEKDSYYQAIKRNTVVIGYAKIGAKPEYSKWHEKYEEYVLEHLIFDIFLEIDEKGNIKVFSGSDKGQKILEEIGYSDYQHIEYAGVTQEGLLDDEMKKIKSKMEAKYNTKLWKELGKECLACGKCSIVCPTCFCFRTMDEVSVDKDKGARSRCWDTCFYNEFSAVAGGHEFNSDIEKKIYFWYEHKFIRIPHEFQIPGCVRCGRCIKTCPVGIDIQKNKDKLLKNKK